MKEGKSLRLVINDHAEQTLKISETLATNSVASEGLAALRAKGIDERKKDEGQENVGTGGGEGAFGESGERPALFELAESGIFNQRAPIVSIENAERFGDIEPGGKDGLGFEGIGLGAPVGDDQGIDGIRLKVGVVEGELVGGISLGIKGGQVEAAAHTDLASVFGGSGRTMGSIQIHLVGRLGG